CHNVFFFSSRRRHTRFSRDWSSDVCSSDLVKLPSPRTIPDSVAVTLPPPAPPTISTTPARAWTPLNEPPSRINVPPPILSRVSQLGRAPCRESEYESVGSAATTAGAHQNPV